MADSPSPLEDIVRKRPKTSRSGRKRLYPRFAAPRPKSTSAELPLSGGSTEQLQAPIKKELALWRAFLGEEIDAILRDKD
jgi:hypothetical protein